MDKAHFYRHRPSKPQRSPSPPQRQMLIALHKAIDLGDRDFILYLSQTANFLNLVNTPLNNITPLTKAIMCHDDQTALALIRLGSYINQPSQGPLFILEKPIISALRVNLYNTVCHLLQKGVDLRPHCSFFKHPLEFAVSKLNLKYVRLILKYDSPIFFPLFCTNPLNLAAQLLNDDYNDPIHTSTLSIIMEELIRAGVNLELSNDENHNPLHLTITSNKPNLTLLLLNAGARIPNLNKYPTKKALLDLQPSDLTSELLQRSQNPDTLKRISRSAIRSTLRKTFNKDLRKLNLNSFQQKEQNPHHLKMDPSLLMYLKLLY